MMYQAEEIENASNISTMSKNPRVCPASHCNTHHVMSAVELQGTCLLLDLRRDAHFGWECAASTLNNGNQYDY
eukprot:scaffold226884_cov21-Prasinocladus_malaysianus.AAC.1